MQKTTIYLDQKEWTQLKLMAGKDPKLNMAQLIRKAIKDFLHKKDPNQSYSFLKRTLKSKPKKSSFGNSIDFQKRLRDEW